MGILDILNVWWYLNRYAFSNVQDEFHIGIVVVVGPSWHRYVMICHFDVLCERHKHRELIFPQIIMLHLHLQYSPQSSELYKIIFGCTAKELKSINCPVICIMLKLTCIGLQVLWGNHHNKSDCPFITKHLIGPAADGAHAFDRCNAIVGN